MSEITEKFIASAPINRQMSAPTLFIGLTRKLLVGEEFSQDSDEMECIHTNPQIDNSPMYDLRRGFIFVYRKIGQPRVFITSVYKHTMRAALSYLLRTCKGASIYGTVECRLAQSSLPFIRQVFTNRGVRDGRIKMQFSDNQINDRVFDFWFTGLPLQLFSTTKEDVCSQLYTQQQLLSPMRSLVMHLHGSSDEELNTATYLMANQLHNFFGCRSLPRREWIFNEFVPSEIRNWQKGVFSIYASDKRVSEYLKQSGVNSFESSFCGTYRSMNIDLFKLPIDMKFNFNTLETIGTQFNLLPFDVAKKTFEWDITAMFRWHWNYTYLTDLSLVFGLKFPPYVMLEIVDWLSCVRLQDHGKKITLLQNMYNSMSRVKFNEI